MLFVAPLPSIPPVVRHEATATVRIERPIAISERDWQRRSEGQHREVIVTDERGRPLILRLVENQ